MIKTLIFDLGNVIVPFNHRKIVEKLQCVCEKASEEIFAEVISAKFVQDYNLGKITSAEFFDSVNLALKLEMNFADFSQTWNYTFEAEPIISEQFVKKLSECYRLLVLSDTNELHFDFIRENFSVLDYFDDFVLSYRVGAVKPSAEIFRAVIEKAECLPDECIFIDDVEKNVEGARRYGMNAIRFISVEQLEAELRAKNLV
jgi:putative hydrolase of the HAD superfamily